MEKHHPPPKHKAFWYYCVVKFLFQRCKVSFPQAVRRNLKYISIKNSSICSYVYLNEFVVSINNSHSHGTEWMFVVAIIGTCSWRLAYSNMFAINGPYAMWKTPPSLKLFSYKHSFIFILRNLQQIEVIVLLVDISCIVWVYC